ncbi:MAG: glycosyltransferase family 4 protein [Anaerolineales bacterium]
MSKTLKRVCLTPRTSGVGGMVTFQHKLSAGFQARGIEVTYDLDRASYEAVLIVGGTRRLNGLISAKNRGIPVIQRLDGLNWLHRRMRTGLRHWLRAELGNRLLACIRNMIATGVVYQSHFVQHWWADSHGPGPAKQDVIYNGVDLERFSPGREHQEELPVHILMVEGSLRGGYELGLESAANLMQELKEQALDVELLVAGNVSEKSKAKWDHEAIKWAGVIPNEQLPSLYRSAHMLYSADLNAACPNSVIEALACGLPVLAFDTGALQELVTKDAGRLASYGGDPWRLDAPDITALTTAALEILIDVPTLRNGSRARAEEHFGIDKMVDAYIEALSG